MNDSIRTPANTSPEIKAKQKAKRGERPANIIDITIFCAPISAKPKESSIFVNGIID